MKHLRLVHSRSGGTLTPEQHERQRQLVEMSLWRSGRSQERRDEAATIARLYSSRDRELHGNVVHLGGRVRPVPPTQPAA